MSEDSAPRVRNPAADPDSSPDKQSELKLNVGIGILGTILSIGVTLIFFLYEENIVLGIVFAVVALVSLVLTLRFHQRRKAAQSRSGAGQS
jgi:membrane protein implicated in regulation of membrane protease activity